jgi:biotin transport system permease protein
MVRYSPGETIAHHFDPRVKLLIQGVFAIAVFSRSDPVWLLGLVGLAGLALAVARCSPIVVLWTFRFPLLLLLLAPLAAMVSLRPPGIDVMAAVDPAMAGSRVVLILFVSAAYIRTTTLRESRAAIQWFVPGRVGVLLGVGVGLTIRLLPTLERDFRRFYDAETTRLGNQRSTIVRIQTLSVGGLERALSRSDRLTVALQTRCFAWNPTLPDQSITYRDIPLLMLSVILIVVLIF